MFMVFVVFLEYLSWNFRIRWVIVICNVSVEGVEVFFLFLVIYMYVVGIYVFIYIYSDIYK